MSGKALHFFLALSFSVTFSLSSTSDNYSKCVPHFGNNFINLTDLVSNNTFLSTSKGNLTLYYHGCTDVEFRMNIMNVTVNTCTEPLSLCLHNATDGSLSKMGRAVDSKFENLDDIPKISYQDMDSKITTVIILVCTKKSRENILVMRNFNKTLYQLELFSPYSCKIEEVLGGCGLENPPLYYLIIANDYSSDSTRSGIRNIYPHLLFDNDKDYVLYNIHIDKLRMGCLAKSRTEDVKQH